MRISLKRAIEAAVAVGTVVALAACGSSSKPAASNTSTTGSANVSISASSFTSDFSAMAQLKSLAS